MVLRKKKTIVKEREKEKAFEKVERSRGEN